MLLYANLPLAIVQQFHCLRLIGKIVIHMNFTHLNILQLINIFKLILKSVLGTT
jgi:hypothetical protein